MTEPYIDDDDIDDDDDDDDDDDITQYLHALFFQYLFGGDVNSISPLSLMLTKIAKKTYTQPTIMMSLSLPGEPKCYQSRFH